MQAQALELAQLRERVRQWDLENRPRSYHVADDSGGEDEADVATAAQQPLVRLLLLSQHMVDTGREALERSVSAAVTGPRVLTADNLDEAI